MSAFLAPGYDTPSSLHAPASFYIPLVHAYWVNGTAANSYIGGDILGSQAAPTQVFAFPRIAALQSLNGTDTICLYHQVNETTFEELYLDVDAGFWLRTIVDVSKLTNVSNA